MLVQGALVDSKYEILANLGEGGMSYVYLARDQRLNKQWAVKEIKQTGDRKKDELIAASFVTEANMMKTLDHPLLPRIVDIVNQNNIIYVVMDYIEGQSLGAVLKEYGPQPQESVIEWGLALCDALDYLHTRTPPIIYRDMKPDNVMLKPDGTIRIIDFGIAREFKESEPDTRIYDTTTLGTRGYAAPEQFGGIAQSDVRTDIYNLGATLYHLLTGKSPAEPPYEMVPIRQIDPSFSLGLEKIIVTCTQPNPSTRYQSCTELYYALENYDKIDDSYFKKQRNKLRVFITSVVFAAVMALSGVAGLIGNAIVLSKDYDSRLALASAASNAQQSQEYYLQAIAIIPDDTRAYLGLIALYKQDNMFDLTEEEQFSKVVQTNLNALKDKGQGYSELAFETGKLYCYYYSYGLEAGGEQITRMQAARPWFADAAADDLFPEQRVAQMYTNIATFETEITARIEEGSDADSYAPYYQSLTELIQLAGEEKNDVVSLRASELSLRALEIYARKFKADGLSKADLLTLYSDTSSLLNTIHPSSSKLDTVKAGLEKRLASTRASLDDAFLDSAFAS